VRVTHQMYLSILLVTDGVCQRILKVYLLTYLIERPYQLPGIVSDISYFEAYTAV